MVDPISYKDVYEKWYPEVTALCPNVPIVLVGTKKDLCSDRETIDILAKNYPSCVPLTTMDGYDMAVTIGAIKYVECSSVLQKGVDDVFIEAFYASIDKTHKTKPYKSNTWSLPTVSHYHRI